MRQRRVEFSTDTDAELVVDAIFAPMYYRLLLRFAQLAEKYGNNLIDQVLLGVRMKQKLSSPKGSSRNLNELRLPVGPHVESSNVAFFAISEVAMDIRDDY